MNTESRITKNERVAVEFEKRLQSLPVDERHAFQMYRHPCQNKEYAGFIEARRCADALRTELGAELELESVRVCQDANGWELEVIAARSVDFAATRAARLFYRGYRVYWRRKQDEAIG